MFLASITLIGNLFQSLDKNYTYNNVITHMHIVYAHKNVNIK